ncbi:MAG: type II secretion system protein [Clostridia bacterium]
MLKEQREKIERKSKGITLIALVVTIIILLILAGVTIYFVVNSGLIGKTEEAKQKSEQSSQNELNTLNEIYAELNGYLPNEETGGNAIQDGVTIPKGFYYVGGTKDSGLIISDSSEDAGKGESWEVAKTLKGNQFVWIPVENIADFKTYEGYYNKKLDTQFSNYIEPYASGYPTEVEEYNSMKASVKANKGFYIARYEGGKENDKLVSKQGANVWTSIPWGTRMSDIGTTGAVYQSQNMYTDKNTYGVNSTLCYGVQWDAVMAFIDPAYKTGTCDVDNSFVANSTGKGNYDEDANTNSWKGNIALAGSSSDYAQKNIYDLAGNAREWTMEAYSNDGRLTRGGDYRNNGSDYPASFCLGFIPDAAFSSTRFSPCTLSVMLNAER